MDEQVRAEYTQPTDVVAGDEIGQKAAQAGDQVAELEDYLWQQADAERR